MKVGLQLYSVREDTAVDFVGTLARVAALGYEGVEFAGYGGLDADVLKGHLDRLGLVAFGSHVPIERLEGDLADQVRCAKSLGFRYLICPWAQVATKEDVLALAARLNAIAEKIRPDGLVLGYHNHAHELFPVDASGTTALELLYAETASAGVIGEADTHWIQRGRQAPRAFLHRNAGRIPLVHIKDMAASGDVDAPVGEGVMDIRGIWEAAAGIGAEWAVVEMDTASFDGIAVGFRNLRKLGLVR
jgi:sugar phosphate isomerase/epimerase